MAFAAGLPAQSPPKPPAVHTVEVSVPVKEARTGDQIKMTAVAKDAAGNPLEVKPTAWFAAPFDLAAADDSGLVLLYGPGEVTVGAIVGGKTGTTKIMVSAPPVSMIEVAPLPAPLVVGGTAQLRATPRLADGDPRNDVPVEWTSETPAIAQVDAAGVVTGVAPGKARLRAQAERVSTGLEIRITANPVARLSMEPATARARTGDVVRFSARAANAAGAAVKDTLIQWSVGPEGAFIEPDGAFYAERPGTYQVRAGIGRQGAVASITVGPRHAEREIEVVGRIPTRDFQTAEEWIIGDVAYVSTVSDKLFSYDVANPARPRLLGMLKVDSRHMNDVSTTPDGKIAVITREGASSRKNGIVFVDTSDPANMKVISEYSATVTGGVHSAFVEGHYVYLTDDATGSLRVIDFRDVRTPKEVARWQVEKTYARTLENPEGPFSAGRYLHDVQVKDGLAYLAFWRDGLVILDVGHGMKGGSPENPRLVSNLRLNYYELYGNGWLAGAHAVFRYKNYVFVGDEVFPPIPNIQSKDRIAVRGVVHVIDVSDLEKPRKVAEYQVPESGAHNVWVEDDILYMGYYNGGGRVVDVSGELRGDLYRQGREIARLWTGDPNGFRANLPFAWGAQPHKGLIYFNDMNSGIWIARLGKPRFQGSATAPAN